MRVVCVKLLDATGEVTSSSPWLSLDSEYVVLEILAEPQGPVFFRILGDDGRTPALYESEMFMTSSATIPANWVAIVRENGNLVIAPEKWTRIGFWEEFFDGNSQAMNDFEEQKNTILAHAYSDA